MLSIILGLVAKILVSHNFFFDFTRLFPTLASQYQLFFLLLLSINCDRQYIVLYSIYINYII